MAATAEGNAAGAGLTGNLASTIQLSEAVAGEKLLPLSARHVAATYF